MEIVTYSSVSENIYMDKKNNHDSLFIVSREPKLRFPLITAVTNNYV